MTKEQFLNKWVVISVVRDKMLPDLEAVIATEIAKVQEAKPQPEELKGDCSTFDMSRLVEQEQSELNPIAQAYEDGKKIRSKRWSNYEWIKKHSKVESITDAGAICKNDWDFYSVPEKWELYTEPTEQPAKPFDRERFERMFRAVLASGVQQNFECFKIDTTYFLQQLDAYYATKEGGNNG